MVVYFQRLKVTPCSDEKSSLVQPRMKILFVGVIAFAEPERISYCMDGQGMMRTLASPPSQLNLVFGIRGKNMKMMCVALLLFVSFLSGIAQPPAASPTAGATQLQLVVVGSDKGAAFLREVQPTLDQLRGRVVSAEGHRNTVLNRDETNLRLSFDTAEAANNFMMKLSGGGSATEGSTSSYSCSDNGMSKVCYFRFGNYRFVCVQANGAASGTCLQM